MKKFSPRDTYRYSFPFVVLLLGKINSSSIKWYTILAVLFWWLTYGHLTEDVDNVQRRFRFAQRGIGWWRIMGVCLWYWNESPIIPKEASRRAKTEKTTSNSVKCEGFAHWFLRLQWRCASWILATRSYGIYNKEFYLEVMCRMRKAIRQKRIEFWKNQSWILQHDNAPAQTSMLVHESLAKNKSVIMFQPWYSPHLGFVYFFLFSKLKTPMKGKRFATTEEIKEKSQQKLFQKWYMILPVYCSNDFPFRLVLWSKLSQKVWNVLPLLWSKRWHRKMFCLHGNKLHIGVNHDHLH